MVKIFIDPGHGGQDPGAGRAPYLEKILVLQVANFLRVYLTSTFENVSVLMSRTSDTTLSLQQRTDMANRWGANFLISVHFNAAGSAAARGYEDFIWNGISNSSKSGQIRSVIHQEVVNRVLTKYGIPNRGKKQANFHMVRESNMEAILVETLFVSNGTDQQLIDRSGLLNEFAVAYGEGIGKAFNLTRKKVVMVAPKPAPAPSGAIFRVQNGAYRDRSNAEALERRIKAAGIPAFTFFDNGLYRVQSGAFSNKTNADNLAARLKNAGFPVYVYRD